MDLMVMCDVEHDCIYLKKLDHEIFSCIMWDNVWRSRVDMDPKPSQCRPQRLRRYFCEKLDSWDADSLIDHMEDRCVIDVENSGVDCVVEIDVVTKSEFELAGSLSEFLIGDTRLLDLFQRASSVVVDLRNVGFL